MHVADIGGEHGRCRFLQPTKSYKHGKAHGLESRVGSRFDDARYGWARMGF